MNARFLRFLSPAERAEAISRDNYYAVMGDVVRVTQSRLSGGHIDLDEKDVEAAYNQAWHTVIIKITKGEQVDNLTGFLIDITYKRSLDIYRQRKEAMHTDEAVDDRPANGDLADETNDRGKLTDLFERLRDRLNVNERKAVALCILHGYSRAEAAKAMEMPEPVFQRIMDSAWKKVTAVATGLQSRGCADDEWARALRAFALGLIDENHRDYARVADHIETCALCRRYVSGLRGLAAVLPPIGLPLIPFVHHGLLHSAVRWLRRLLGGHGTGTTAAGAGAGGSTAGGAAVGAGAVKVAAVVATLAIAGGAVVATDHHARHPASHPQPTSPAAEQFGPAAAALETPSFTRSAATTHRATRQHTTHTSGQSLATGAAHDLRTIREFGMEHPRSTHARAAQATQPAPQTPAATPTARPAAHKNQERAPERPEFTFEQK